MGGFWNRYGIELSSISITRSEYGEFIFIVSIGFSRAKPPAIRKVDLQNKEEIVGLLDEVKPKVLVHCEITLIWQILLVMITDCARLPLGAAERFPDKCESDPEGVKKLNVRPPLLPYGLIRHR